MIFSKKVYSCLHGIITLRFYLFYDNVPYGKSFKISYIYFLRYNLILITKHIVLIYWSNLF